MLFQLVTPSLEHLPSYKAALETGWGPNNLYPAESAKDELLSIAKDPALFIKRMYDVEAKGEPVTMVDGTKVKRLPGYRLWMWDGEFCGYIGFRWQPGTPELPSYVLGHIGYSVVPWKRQRGYATNALAQLLPQAKERGLPYVDLTAKPDNLPSQKVITANGGIMIRKFTSPAEQGGEEGLLFRINLS